jgi:hypothetical protein
MGQECRNRAGRAQARAVALRRRAEAAPSAATPVDAAPDAASVVPARLGGALDRALALQVEETLALLPIRRRRMLLRYFETGNARQAVVEAGYNVKSPKTATEVGREILASPAVQHAYQALLEARGLSGAKLDQIHAVHLARHSSPDTGDRDRSLRAVGMARKYLVPQPAAGTRALPDALIDKMSEPELRCFIASGTWPAWAAAELRRAGFSLRRNGAAQASAETPGGDAARNEDDTDNDPAPGPTVAETPPPARPPGAPEPDPTPPPEVAAHAPHREPVRQPPRDSGVGGGADWRRPEDRVYDPRRAPPPPPALAATSEPPAAEPASEADPIAEAKRMAALRAVALRDCRW